MVNRKRVRSIVFVNAYETEMAFGGPEEGGWYYEVGYATCSKMLFDPTEDQIEVAEKEIKEALAKRGIVDFRIRYQNHAATNYPEDRPVYC